MTHMLSGLAGGRLVVALEVSHFCYLLIRDTDKMEFRAGTISIPYLAPH
jgi:hypothetical protein